MTVPPPRKFSETALVHLYRGELDRMTSYRVRLDTTTNWAIAMNAALLSFAFSQAGQLRYVAFPLAMLLTVMFLWLEARRYRGFRMIQERVRLLETGLFAEVLDRPSTGDWRERLAVRLASPAPRVTYRQAVSVRLRRAYLWLFVVDYAAWLYGVFVLDAQRAVSQTWPLPKWLVLGFAGAVVLVLVGLSFTYPDPEKG